MTTDEDNKRLKTELSEMKARHRLEIERVTREKEQEMDEVHKRSVSSEFVDYEIFFPGFAGRTNARGLSTNGWERTGERFRAEKRSAQPFCAYSFAGSSAPIMN